ncbi:sensor histidine kinase [Thermus albus]|uniref:sensor histidine kinase n=1 Tax=Thermus albus TaxID=2908146 RepID=UPI001FAAD214
MSLRDQLALAFFLVAAASGLLVLGVGYYSFRNLMEEDIRQDLAGLAYQVRSALALTPEGPVVAHEKALWTNHYSFGFRLWQGERVVLEWGSLPQGEGPWRSQYLDWEGYRLEVVLWVGGYVRALESYLRSALPPLALLLLLAFLLGHAAAGLLARPLERLAQGVERLAALRFPDPLPPVPGREMARVVWGFNRLVEAVRSALERERLFTRYASHELRNPLGVLQSQLEALERGLMPLEGALSHMQQAVDRIRAVLDGLLALARLEGEDLKPLELKAFLESYLRERAPLGETLAFEAPQPAWVLAEPSWLERLLENLLENARRHGAPPFHLALEVQGEWVVLRLRDHGPGVPEEFLSRLTRPFFRMGPGAGLGLGLALAEQVVARLGGELAFVRAHPGLQVVVRLPRWKPG